MPRNSRLRYVILLTLLGGLGASSCLRGQSAGPSFIWVEGEKPIRSTMTRHPWWYDRVQKDQLSGGDLLSNWSDKQAGEAEYIVAAPAAGEYELWVRANPVQSRLSYRLNEGVWSVVV